MSTCTLQPPTTPTEIHRRVVIEFLYINLTTCSRCLGTDAQIEAALALVRPVLATTGIEVELRKILVESEAQARALRFASSPTIRIDGHDIALGLVESSCGSCSEIAGQATECREWVYRGRRYTEAPVGMIVETLLGALYGREPAPAQPYTDVPENLKRFFEARLSCCSPAEQDSCGAASEKAERSGA